MNRYAARDNRVQTILWVDLSDGCTRLETLPAEWTRKYLGCRGVNARLLFDEVKAGTDPFGPDNVLLMGTGPMDGLLQIGGEQACGPHPTPPAGSAGPLPPQGKTAAVGPFS